MLKRILLVFVLLLLVGCSQDVQENDIFTITSSGSFSHEDCDDMSLTGKYVMVESKSCSHCQETLPYFIEACEEMNRDCIILDVSEQDDFNEMLSYGINVMYTPTFVLDCNIYVGAMLKDDYVLLMQ